MYANMLIAVDDSEFSRHALRQALRLAVSEESSVTIVAVVPSYEGDLRFMGSTSALKDMRKPYEKALEDARKTALEAGVNARCLLLDGDPVEQILAKAETTGADCIALGKRGNFYSDLVPIGSVASKVARLAEADVFIVPNHKELCLDRVVVPLDGSSHSMLAAKLGVKIAARYGSLLSLLTVHEIPLEGFVHNPDMDKEFYQRATSVHKPLLQQAAEGGVRRSESVLRQGVPAYGVILEFIRQEACGLVVMGSSGRGQFARLLLGSVAERIIGSGAAPVLLAKKETA